MVFKLGLPNIHLKCIIVSMTNKAANHTCVWNPFRSLLLLAAVKLNDNWTCVNKLRVCDRTFDIRSGAIPVRSCEINLMSTSASERDNSNGACPRDLHDPLIQVTGAQIVPTYFKTIRFVGKVIAFTLYTYQLSLIL